MRAAGPASVGDGRLSATPPGRAVKRKVQAAPLARATIASMSAAFPSLQLVHERRQPLGDYRIHSNFRVIVARPLERL